MLISYNKDIYVFHRKTKICSDIVGATEFNYNIFTEVIKNDLIRLIIYREWGCVMK